MKGGHAGRPGVAAEPAGVATGVGQGGQRGRPGWPRSRAAPPRHWLA